MASLESYLSDLSTPQVKWIKARVQSIQSGFLTLTYLNGVITNAGYLRQYTPVVGDIVHCLSYEPMGVLVLGTAAGSAPGTGVPIPQPATIISASSMATYDKLLGTWTPGIVWQDSNLIGCFFYTPGAFSALASTSFQKVEVEITVNGGGPPELTTHLNAAPSGPVVLSVGDLWRPDTGNTSGTSAWVTVPLGWGKDLATGVVKGIAITTSLGVHGVYSGTGRVRLTPLSVTI